MMNRNELTPRQVASTMAYHKPVSVVLTRLDVIALARLATMGATLCKARLESGKPPFTEEIEPELDVNRHLLDVALGAADVVAAYADGAENAAVLEIEAASARVAS